MFTFDDLFDTSENEIPLIIEDLKRGDISVLDIDRLIDMLEDMYGNYCDQNGLCIECGEEKQHIKTQIGEVGGQIIWEDIFMCPNNH